MIEITMNTTDNRWWKRLILLFAQPGTPFEIHCWQDELQWIAAAQQFGTVQPSPSGFNGVVIAGVVTQPLIDFLQHTVKPADTEICNKQTPLFSIFLNGFSSEHYGTELHITTPPEQINGLPQLLQELSVSDDIELGTIETDCHLVLARN